MRRAWRVLRWVVVAVAAAVALPFGVVQAVGQSHVRPGVDDVPPADVALVLGAGLRPDGSPSTYLRRRLDAAAELYAAGTVRAVLVSGDSSRPGYDEPTAMREWLVDRGVAAEHVVQDYAGLDTHDSCVRAVQVFGARSVVVVTQSYHLRRALFSCDAAGLAVSGVGVSAASVRPAQALTWRAREVPASVKAGWDALVARPPAIGGEPEPGLADALGSAATG